MGRAVRESIVKHNFNTTYYICINGKIILRIFVLVVYIVIECANRNGKLYNLHILKTLSGLIFQ